MDGARLPPVGRTAVGVAALRALESGRPDRLFDDPYAGAFFHAGRALFEGRQRRDGSLGAVFAQQVAIRTRYYDEFVADAGQVVILAAGLDARAFRLPWADGARLYELDLPEVLEFKDFVLNEQGARARCARTVVPVDLRADWANALLEAGFDRTRPTVWLAEGLLVYLSRDEAERLLIDVTALSAPGSRVSFEHRPEGAADGLLRRARAVGSEVTDLWQGGLGPQAPEWLNDHGWTPETVAVADLAARYGREPEDRTRGGFVTATRRG
ncbi:SAM-dependent methyltransferase [Amycolatopsis jiangsuensis]|uniref:S-adenosyl-L-methionine-dependent methyltransferase n=1 Tax=Amycolatopsis jiangsuensis TaxID=1181879 RepID=A0A840J2A7_9PSEU|nr:SAM-dependent methyltransferase [Amycolatopsis jiangsuensis]MBB4687617.1 methyltransferase (TIGR00027 family) [Amycolatopsis jiangsuensis]